MGQWAWIWVAGGGAIRSGCTTRSQDWEGGGAAGPHRGRSQGGVDCPGARESRGDVGPRGATLVTLDYTEPQQVPVNPVSLNKPVYFGFLKK